MVGKIFQCSRLLSRFALAIAALVETGLKPFLAPKLQLGDPLWSKALLCKAH
jgi:hypothetical protein